MAGNSRSHPCRQNPDEDMVVHEQSLSHLSRVAGLHVSYLISQKS